MIFPIPVKGEVHKGQNIGDCLIDAARQAGLDLQDGDIIVVTQKIVSKAEGKVAASPADPADREKLVRSESVRIVRQRGTLIIAETRHGFICANAGIDSSNVEPGCVTLLPEDPDASARKIRSRLKAKLGVNAGIVISDTFGRAWRVGQTNIAIGVAGIVPFNNYHGTTDTFGVTLHVTNIAVADELAGAAELVMGKAEGTPFALVRGANVKPGRGSARQLVRPPQGDLFR